MPSLILLFLILQVILLVCMTLHDWVHIPPLTDIRELEKHSTKKGRLINSSIFFALVFVPLVLTWLYRFEYPIWVLIIIASLYGLLSLGTILSWWVPYLFGSSDTHKEGFIEYRTTHHFLPMHGDNVIPNTLHVILHLQIWACLGTSLYLLFTHYYN